MSTTGIPIVNGHQSRMKSMSVFPFKKDEWRMRPDASPIFPRIVRGEEPRVVAVCRPGFEGIISYPAARLQALTGPRSDFPDAVVPTPRTTLPGRGGARPPARCG